MLCLNLAAMLSTNHQQIEDGKVQPRSLELTLKLSLLKIAVFWDVYNLVICN